MEVKFSSFKAISWLLVLCLVLGAFGAFTVSAVPTDLHPDKAYKAGKLLYDKGNFSGALPYFFQAVKGNPSAANLRITADTLVHLKRFDEAVSYYEKAAAKYKTIDPQAAIALSNKAKQYASEVRLYTVARRDLPLKSGLAKYEPQNGMYFGAFVEYEPAMTGQPKATFNTLTGVQHPIFYTYHHYGQPFPVNWAAGVKSAGGAIHLALEATNGLSAIQNDAYLKSFARDCAKAEMPIFLRLNSEMNGDWTPWHQTPQRYIETFRLVASVMKTEAPNVAMVWAPNSVPVDNILRYYPGDEYVDWVGVNLYSVSVFNGDSKAPATHVNPLDLLDYVYSKFAAKKPIQVAEFAATHYSAAEKKDTTAFALAKMRLLYHGVKYKYPRVKSIQWYSANNLVKAHSPERRLNNFSLLENAKLLAAYGQMLASDYYLKQVVNGPFATSENLQGRPVYETFDSSKLKAIADAAGGKVNLEIYAKTHDPFISKVVYKIDGQIVGTATAFPYASAMNYSGLPVGKHTLELLVFDSKGLVATKKAFNFTK